MVLSLLALLVIIAALLLFNRSCSFSPGGPEIDPSSAPTVDVRPQFEQVARTVDFSLRLPAVPARWRANSTTTNRAGADSVVVRAGWLTPDRFVGLSQSRAAAPELVELETGARAEPTGSVEVDGTQWTVYPGVRAERAWAAALGGTTTLITGTGTEDEFRTLATAVQAAQPLPRS
ncbi:hypothetical protein BJP25_03525 [Actinokineospora bangkokensis]|uniref:DUF4245 domain-containing protein n=2 Tax=Actinokineospora bangkokensis TaxID=1193682 RepID=A0A1Q9LE94_9PSEU|nr:hypothetical protein BJP25_03525 [Actinokineospora bangkokensis]